MAREIHEREDLLRDARAFVPRLKLRASIDRRETEVFAGFRGESLSLYFGDEPVYHFNSRGELRRGFVDNCLIKAEGGGLVALTRKQSLTESVLERQKADSEFDRRFVARMVALLGELSRSLANGDVEIVGEEPAGGGGVHRLTAWLKSHPTPLIAELPNVD